MTIAKGLLANTGEDRGVWLEMGQMCVQARRWKEAEEDINKAEALTTKKEEAHFSVLPAR